MTDDPNDPPLLLGETYLRATVCPYCGKCNTSATQTMSGQVPKDGDVSICVQCAHCGIFDSPTTGGVRRTTAKEAAEIATNDRISRLRLALLAVKQKAKARQINGEPPFTKKRTNP